MTNDESTNDEPETPHRNQWSTGRVIGLLVVVAGLFAIMTGFVWMSPGDRPTCFESLDGWPCEVAHALYEDQVEVAGFFGIGGIVALLTGVYVMGKTR